MKRNCFILLAFFSFFRIFSQTADGFQSVFPINPYFGDTVEIRYVFHSELNLLASDSEKNHIVLDEKYPVFLAWSEKFTVVSAYIENVGNEYTFLMNIVPWKTGRIEFPHFDLCSLIAYSTKEDEANAYFYMELSPIEVGSLAKKKGVHSILPASGPLLMPGTIFLVSLFLVAAVLLFGAILFVVLNIPSIKTRLSQFKYLYSMKKLSRKTIKKLLKLKSLSGTIKRDADFAMRMQRIFRDYLSKYFSEDFGSLTSTEVMQKLSEVFDHEIPERFERVDDNFVRMDYIRFADGRFSSGEREGIVDELIKIVEAG